MSSFTIREFTADDIPQIMSLQQAYRDVYSKAVVIPGEAYLSAGFDDGKNIFCAFDERGFLQGYAPLFPNLTEDPRMPHTVWAEVKARPEFPALQAVKDLLFERVRHRAEEITGAHPGHSARLVFQYHPSEKPAIEYVMARGFGYSESVFRMMCDLGQELSAVPHPEHIDVRPWRMEKEKEQQAYVQAHNEVFPEAPIALVDWQSFLSSSAWQDGTTFTAFDEKEIVGSVALYWDETISQQAGRKAGYTENVFVRANWRKRGIAAFLIYTGLIYLRDRGREAAFLEVKAANQRALDLYFRLGYQLIDETHFYVRDL